MATPARSVELEYQAGCCAGSSPGAVDISPYQREIAKLRAEKAQLEAKLRAVESPKTNVAAAVEVVAEEKPATAAEPEPIPVPVSNGVAPTARKLWLAQADEAIAAGKPEDEPGAVGVDQLTVLVDSADVSSGSSSSSSSSSSEHANGFASPPPASGMPGTPSAVDRPKLELATGQPVTVMTPDKWIPDFKVNVCQNATCKREFSLINRKHHCRLCGGIFCGSCTASRLLLPNPVMSPSPAKAAAPAVDAGLLSTGSSKNVLSAGGSLASQRVCDECFAKAGAVRASLRPRPSMKSPPPSAIPEDSVEAGTSDSAGHEGVEEGSANVQVVETSEAGASDSEPSPTAAAETAAPSTTAVVAVTTE